uniref:CSON005795 protein n=1 Tax=Culicoides sonorensis TaxID=179676 RepID=A0A336M0P5_CULSO
MELIIKIFSYLHPSDIEAASSTCLRFFEASKYYRFMDQRLLSLHKINFTEYEPPISTLLETERYFSNITLYVVRFSDYNHFWCKFGRFVKSLTLKMCIVKKDKFLQILSFLPNLETLTLYDCNELLNRWQEEVFEDMIKPSLPKLKRINFQKITILKPHVFDYLFDMAPKLEYLEISECFTDCTDAVARVKIIDHAIQSLTKKAKKGFKCLNLLGTHIDDIALLKLAEIPDLKLNQLSLTFTGRITNPGMLDLLKVQTNLTSLDLSDSMNLLDYCLMLICSKMPHLKQLKLKRCVMITDIGIREIVHLKNLLVLDITGCERISDKGFLEGVKGQKWCQWKEYLEELYIGSTNGFTEYTLSMVTSMFLYLTKLDVSSSGNCITDYTMQLINKNLLNLRFLNAECCGKISDAGICAEGFIDERCTFSYPYRISRLKGLRILRLSGIYQISDVSLRHFRFLELKELTMARCQLITEVGIEFLSKYCPSLEYIDLTECQNINDYCIELITSYLQRLLCLRVICCNQLTDLSVDSVIANCTRIKTLYIRGCNLITYEALQTLSKVSSLKNIYTNYETVDIN